MDLFTSHRPQTWFTADLHLGHQRIIDLAARPFATVDEMNETLIERWNERVDDVDVVWVLGDHAMGTLDESLALTARLNGKKYLVAGNHDCCFHGYGDHHRRLDKLVEQTRRYLDAGFVAVVDGRGTHNTGSVVTLPLRDESGAVVHTVGVCHFPVTGESDSAREDRHDRYRPRVVAKRDLPADVYATQPRYEWLLHGHVHNEWTIHGKEINVGVDVWDFAPVAASTLIALIDAGMPPCECDDASAVGTHMMGSPGCVINGGPPRRVDAPS